MFYADNLKTAEKTVHGFFGRRGGVSKAAFSSLNVGKRVGDNDNHVFENRQRLCDTLGNEEGILAFAKQVHGNNILSIKSLDNIDAVEEIEADAIFTKLPGVMIGVQTADCAPLLMTDVEGRGVMAVHLGWKGAASGLTEKSVDYFCKELQIKPSEVICAIGPCIGPTSFEVRSDVVAALRSQISEEGVAVKKNQEHFLVDLAGWIQKILINKGVDDIQELGLCTFLNDEKFFSYRRDKGVTGRQASVIMIRNR